MRQPQLSPFHLLFTSWQYKNKEVNLDFHLFAIRSIQIASLNPSAIIHFRCQLAPIRNTNLPMVYLGNTRQPMFALRRKNTDNSMGLTSMRLCPTEFCAFGRLGAFIGLQHRCHRLFTLPSREIERSQLLLFQRLRYIITPRKFSTLV